MHVHKSPSAQFAFVLSPPLPSSLPLHAEANLGRLPCCLSPFAPACPLSPSFAAAISTLARGSHPVPPLAPHQLLSSAAGLASPLRHEQQLLNHRLPHSLATALAGPSFAGVGASSGVGLRMQQSMGGEEGDGGRRAWAGESEQLDLLRDKGFKKGDRVILYDGVCNMCNGWVTYVLRNNKKGDFKFAALQVCPLFSGG